MFQAVLVKAAHKEILYEQVLYEECCVLQKTMFCAWPHMAPEAGSSTAVAALGSHQAGQQVQGPAALSPDAGQHIAVGVHQAGLQAGRPILVAVGAVGRHLDAACPALLAA